jgi:hypothetical protein
MNEFSSKNPINELLRIFCSYCKSKNIPYVIIEGIAAIFWGRIRTTQDIDIIIDHRKLNINDFVLYMNENGVSCSEEDLTQAFSSKQHSNINFYHNTPFRLDIKGIYSELEEVTLKESKEQEWEDMILYIDDIHNLIVHKLRFGSQQDQEDALAILVRNYEHIDQKKLYLKARRLNVKADLEKLLNKVKKT